VPAHNPASSILKPERLLRRQIDPVQPPVNLQRAAKPPGTIDQHSVISIARIKIAAGNSSRSCDHIQAVMHAVDEIDVSPTARTEHDLGSTRFPFDVRQALSPELT
jgi:hypothetical protein